jgi:hypothetical protein
MTPIEKSTYNLIRKKLLNLPVPPKFGGQAGRYIEKQIIKLGCPFNKGKGVDLKFLGWEIKSRDVTSTSAVTLSAMHPLEIITTPYIQSLVREKSQKILLFTTKDLKIKNIKFYDLSDSYIQDKLCEAYEHGRKQIICYPDILYTEYTGFFGYFENTNKDRSELSFRLSKNDLKNIREMANPQINKLFSFT